VSALNVIVRNRHIIEENANQSEDVRLFFEEVNTLLIMYKNFHSV
jgi:hypothetical protein